MACLPVERFHLRRHGNAGCIGDLDFAAAGGARETQRDVGTVEGIDVIHKAMPPAGAVVSLVEDVDVHGLATRHLELDRLVVRHHAVRLPTEPLVGGFTDAGLLCDQQVRRGAVIVLEGDARGLVKMNQPQPFSKNVALNITPAFRSGLEMVIMLVERYVDLLMEKAHLGRTVQTVARIRAAAPPPRGMQNALIDTDNRPAPHRPAPMRFAYWQFSTALPLVSPDEDALTV